MTRKSLHVIKSDFSAHAREHAPGYKTVFPVPRARGLDIFQNNSRDSNLGQSPDECMAIPMLISTAQRQKLALIFSCQKCLFSGVQRHLVTWSTSMQKSIICFILCWQPSHIECVLQLWESRFSMCFVA